MHVRHMPSALPLSLQLSSQPSASVQVVDLFKVIHASAQKLLVVQSTATCLCIFWRWQWHLPEAQWYTKRFRGARVSDALHEGDACRQNLVHTCMFHQVPTTSTGTEAQWVVLAGPDSRNGQWE